MLASSRSVSSDVRTPVGLCRFVTTMTRVRDVIGGGDALGRDGEAVGGDALERAHDRAEPFGGARQRLVARVLDEHLVAGREHRRVGEEDGVRGPERGHDLVARDIVVECNRLTKAPRSAERSSRFGSETPSSLHEAAGMPLDARSSGTFP